MWTATLQTPQQQQQQPQQPQPHPPPQQRAASAQGHRPFLRTSNSNVHRSASHPHPTRQVEKEAVSQHGAAACRREVLPPERIAEDAAHKQWALSSQPLQLADFELMKTLGTGTFARVWLCRFARPRKAAERDKVFALKVLRKVDVIKLKQVEHVRNERNVLAAVAGHPFITTLVTSFSDETSLYMLLDYTPGGEIFSYLRRARRFPVSTVQFYAAEITLILAYLHDVQHVAYRDLKPENILLDAEGHLKLVDFGFAKYLPPAPDVPEHADAGTDGDDDAVNGDGGDSHGAGVTYTLCGTPEYLAPEVIRNSGHGTAVDWWALGILVYEMLIGQPPFWDPNPLRIYEQIVAGHIRFPTNHSSSGRGGNFYVPRAARDFILALCKTDPSERLGHIAGGSRRVQEHWFFDGVDWDAIYYKRVRGPIIPRVEWAGDAGNFDEYPDPDEAEESEAGRGNYTNSLRDIWEPAFADF